MARLFFQPEGLFKVTFDIFGTRDSRRKQASGMDCDQNVPFTANLSWTLYSYMSVHLYTGLHFSLTAYRFIQNFQNWRSSFTTQRVCCFCPESAGVNPQHRPSSSSNPSLHRLT